ncbi:DUF2851 family protein [Faecalibacter macacae]|uniref:DUF2851 family protein n=1 Tax=Faecalibacter macacae TaxID=1859289 RepID=A0A3L9MMR1_9FLAO|nr:DUF2851 family protein [Faecalibacter macacae]RLZ11979.1 DUF2851 family protein [Faecalibacter macacae]
MKESFLHYIWQMKCLNITDLKTFHGSSIEIINFGKLNHDSGPDFYNAEIVINKQLWVGCVEMHVNSSDWNLHHHSEDESYQNVILHVVWKHDKEIDKLRQSNVETLILEEFVPKEVIFNYQQIVSNKLNQIHCKGLLNKIDWDKISFWFDRLLIDRLEEKSNSIFQLYEESNNSWEEVTFKLLASNFGLKVNKEAFEIWSKSFPFSVLQKNQSDKNRVEALFFSQAGFLEDEVDEYVKELKNEYNFLQRKYDLNSLNKSIFKFSSMRPHGFPTIRLAQLSSIYSVEKSLFSKIVSFQSIKEIEVYFRNFEPNDYWKTHFVFGKESKETSKQLSISKIHNLIINTILPLKFAYELTNDQLDIDYYLEILKQLKVESNSIVETFIDSGFRIKSAKDSQSVIHLKKRYCDEKKCLNCAIGTEVLK